MRGEAMKKICDRLEDRGISLEAVNALEFFAREGDWQATAYAGRIKNVEAWEIDPQFESGLKKNLPQAKIRICDSYQEATLPEHREQFDLIVFDNPQGCFGENHCEHFDALENVPNLIKSQGTVVFNVNWAPFNYDKESSWAQRRNTFYGLEEASEVPIDFFLDFYGRHFKKQGFRVVFSFHQNRNDEYLAYLVFHLKKERAA